MLGPPIEAHVSFPNRTNVSWYTELEGASSAGEDAPSAGEDAPSPVRSSCIRARIFERGVGETLSSGTGATGAAIAHVLEGDGPPARVTVVLDAGELQVEVAEDLRVHLTGWARPVFSGRLSDEFVEELRELK